MSQRVYISADYSADDGDRDVINELHSWERMSNIKWIMSILRKLHQEAYQTIKIVARVI